MKNIFLIPAKNPQVSAKGQIYLATHDIPDTHYPIRLVRSEPNSPTSHRKECIRQELFITSDEKIREGDWCMSLCDDESYEEIYQCKKAKLVSIEDRKIILTTDIDLIKDGVQPIPDEFLEWFVKNPSCEFVEIKWVKTPDGIFYHQDNVPYGCYKIIIPKEEITGDEFDIVIKPTYNKTFNASLKIFPKEKPKEEIPNDLDSVLAKISDVNDLEISNWYEVVYYYDNKWYSYNGSKTFNNDEQVLEWKYCKEIF